jgi:hypothetical protein
MSLKSIGTALLWLGGAYLLWVIAVLVLARLGKIPLRKNTPGSAESMTTLSPQALALGSLGTSWGLALSALVSMVTKRGAPTEEIAALREMALPRPGQKRQPAPTSPPEDLQQKRSGDQSRKDG